MRKIFLSIAIASSLAFASSCNQFDLDLRPEDSFSTIEFWKTEEQVNGAMNGLHSQLRDNQATLWNLGEIRGGTLRNGTGFTGSSTLNSGNLIIQDIRESNAPYSGWAGFYASIFQVNNFIYQVEKATYLSDTKKSYFLGQAFGLRAYYYFQLFKTFGRLPIVTRPEAAIKVPSSAEEAYTPRTKTEKETLDFIKADIEESEKGFNKDYAQKERKAQWSLAATEMLKTEVYLWSAKVKVDGEISANANNDLLIAKTAVELVIPRFALLSNYADVFSTIDNKPDAKGNSEIIFAMRYQVGEATNGLFQQFLYVSNDVPANTYKDAQGEFLEADPLRVANSGTLLRYEYKIDLFDSFDNIDTRKNSIFFNLNKGTNRAVVLSKYLGTFVNGVRNYSDDYPVYRLSEAYLYLAEIKNKLGQDPTSEIMLVRNRAYNGNAPQFVNGSFADNEMAIFQERSKEFVAEGKRWYDLLRMQDAAGNPLVFSSQVGVLQNVTGQKHKVLWPIDIKTLTEDPTLTGQQNPGYSGT